MKITNPEEFKKYLDETYINENAFSFWQSDVKIGPSTIKAYKNVSNKLKHRESRERQLAKAIEIISCCNISSGPKGIKKTGLVVGKVQSGKTTSFTLVSALAADNGYKIVIHLLGTTSNLLASNYADVVKVLGIEDNTPTNWKTRIVQSHSQGGIDLNSQTLANLVSGNSASMVSGNKDQVLYMPLLKDTASIILLTDLLKSTPIIGSIPILIIDDEVDSHGMNVAKKKPSNIYNSSIEGSQSPTNSHLSDLRDACGTVTYLGYTATAQGPIWQHPNNFMSPDFHAMLYPGKGYVGNEELFGEPRNRKHERLYDHHKDWNHQVKEINVTVIDPITGKDIDDNTQLKNSIFDSVCTFLVSYVLLRKRQQADPDNPNNKALSMMLHTSTRTGKQGNRDGEINHQEAVILLKDYLENSLWASLNSGPLNIDFKRIKSAYEEKALNIDTKYKNSLPSFDMVLKQIKKILDPNVPNLYEIREVNARKDMKISDVKFDNSEMWFLVGGIGLSRGFVIEGLLTTWMPVQPQNIIADTMEQRGRFFGYKKPYLDLITVFIKEKTMEAFRGYITHEDSLWTELKNLLKKGESLQGTDPYFHSCAAISGVTSSSKMRVPVTTLRVDWVTCKTLPFITNPDTGQCDKDQNFHQLTDKFIKKLNLKRPTINPWNANVNGDAPGQNFIFQKCSLDQVYDYYLSKIPGIDSNEEYLSEIIKLLESEYCGHDHKGHARKNACDVVLFNQGERQVVFDSDHAPNQWAWPKHGYRSSATYSKTNKKKDYTDFYCGDDKVILGRDFDPFNYPSYDEEHNYNTTIQIHHFDSVYERDARDNKIVQFENVYAVRIKLQHSKTFLTLGKK